jgi:hypothetical protein
MQNVNEDLKGARERLSELRKQITTKDKQKLYAEHGMNPATLSLYLNRKGNNLDTAVMLITFFNNCIAERRKMLAKAV